MRTGLENDSPVTNVEITEITMPFSPDKGSVMTAADLPDDVFQELTAMDAESYQSLAHEEEANAQNLSHLIGMGATRMFEEEDPIEAVVQSKILTTQ